MALDSLAHCPSVPISDSGHESSLISRWEIRIWRVGSCLDQDSERGQGRRFPVSQGDVCVRSAEQTRVTDTTQFSQLSAAPMVTYVIHYPRTGAGGDAMRISAAHLWQRLGSRVRDDSLWHPLTFRSICACNVILLYDAHSPHLFFPKSSPKDYTPSPRPLAPSLFSNRWCPMRVPIG